MANQNKKMSDKTFCPYWNSGFCKFLDQCRKEHETNDCNESQCDRRTCQNRHRKQCKFYDRCKYFKKKTCQFLHSASKNVYNSNKQALKEQTKKHLSDIAKLKDDIEMLKKMYQRKKVSLMF